MTDRQEERDAHGGSFFSSVLGLITFLLPSYQLQSGSAPSPAHTKGCCLSVNHWWWWCNQQGHPCVPEQECLLPRGYLYLCLYQCPRLHVSFWVSSSFVFSHTLPGKPTRLLSLAASPFLKHVLAVHAPLTGFCYGAQCGVSSHCQTHRTGYDPLGSSCLFTQGALQPPAAQTPPGIPNATLIGKLIFT